MSSKWSPEIILREDVDVDDGKWNPEIILIEDVDDGDTTQSPGHVDTNLFISDVNYPHAGYVEF